MDEYQILDSEELINKPSLNKTNIVIKIGVVMMVVGIGSFGFALSKPMPFNLNNTIGVGGLTLFFLGFIVYVAALVKNLISYFKKIK